MIPLAVKLVIILAILVFCNVSRLVAQTDDCEGFREIYSAKSALQQFKGAYDSDVMRFVATRTLPGVDRCFIDENYKTTYRCQWTFDLSNEEQFKRNFSELVSSVRKCLPASDIRSDSKSSVLEVGEIVPRHRFNLRDSDNQRNSVQLVTGRYIDDKRPERSYLRITMYLEGS